MKKFWNFLFGDREFNRKLISLTLPISMQNLMLALVAAADALMLGKLNQDAMAAVSLATQVQFIQNMLLYSIVCGVGVLGAQYWGKKDKVVLGKIFGSSIREAMLVSLAFFVGCYYFPHALMRLFASDPILINIGAEYLKLASWSYLITGVSQCYLAIMRVSDHATSSAWISSGAVVINIIFNALFIFGLCGFPEIGVRGAAVATILARVIELAACILCGLNKSFIRLQLKMVFTFDRVLFCDFWRYSLPILASCLLWGIGFTSYTAIMGHLGRDAAAANSIAAVVRDLICCLCNGLAGACGILIGNKLGAGELETGKLYGERTLILSIVAGFFSSLVILSLIPLISNFVKLTEQAHYYMVWMFVILAFYMIGRSICGIVINGIFSSGGDTMFDMYILIIFMWCIALPCAFLGAFYFHLPVLLVYCCTCLDEVGKVPCVIIHFRKYKWVKNLTR